MIKAWTEEAWEDFEYWTTQDRRMLKRILQLLKDIDRIDGSVVKIVQCGSHYRDK